MWNIKQTNTQYDKHNVTFDRRTTQLNSKTLFKDGDPVSSQLDRRTTQLNSKTLFKDGDPVSSQLIFQTCEQYNNFSYIYTKQHRFIGQTQANTTYNFIQKHIHKHLYNVYTNMYIHHTLSLMNKKEQYIVNNKHIEHERYQCYG